MNYHNYVEKMTEAKDFRWVESHRHLARDKMKNGKHEGMKMLISWCAWLESSDQQKRTLKSLPSWLFYKVVLENAAMTSFHNSRHISSLLTTVAVCRPNQKYWKSHRIEGDIDLVDILTVLHCRSRALESMTKPWYSHWHGSRPVAGLWCREHDRTLGRFGRF